MSKYLNWSQPGDINLVTEIRLILTSLLCTFITLKLTGLIMWSWVWVLAPFWIPVALTLGAIIYVYGRSKC